MKIIISFVVSSFAIFTLTACQTSKNNSGFITDGLGAFPIARSYEEVRPPISFDSNVANRKVVIYSHGTSNDYSPENCRAKANRVPQSIMQLEKREDWSVYYLCSQAINNKKDGEWIEISYIFNRKTDITKTLDELIGKGIKPNHIFLAGHSAGAWASLLTMDVVGEKFNSAILFAPACCGNRTSHAGYMPEWQNVNRPNQVKI